MQQSSARPRRFLVSAFALLGAFGCKQEEPNIAPKDFPKEMAAGYCGAVYSCACESYPYGSFNECFVRLNSAYEKVNNEAYLAGLQYDGSCPVKELDQIDQLACKNWVPELPEGVCVRPCNAWYGPAGLGQICSVVASEPGIGAAFSTCAQGLTCFSGVCVDPCQIKAVPGPGEPCPDLVCKAGSMCDANQICVVTPDLPGPGEVCADGLCDSDRAVCVTEANVCAALPAPGQSCVQGQCDRSSYCGESDICLARPALACFLVAPDPSGDGDGDPTGDGDGDPTTGDGDGDGDPTTGDGDGDGDGDPTTGDGDGDPGDGDGDGDDDGCGSPWLPIGFPIIVNGSTLGGSIEHFGSCAGGSNGPERTYRFSAPVTGTYWMSLSGSSFDTILYVRDASCFGSELACNDDYDDDLTSALQVFLYVNQQVTIFVDGYGQSGNYTLRVDLL